MGGTLRNRDYRPSKCRQVRPGRLHKQSVHRPVFGSVVRAMTKSSIPASARSTSLDDGSTTRARGGEHVVSTQGHGRRNRRVLEETHLFNLQKIHRLLRR